MTCDRLGKNWVSLKTGVELEEAKVCAETGMDCFETRTKAECPKHRAAATCKPWWDITDAERAAREIKLRAKGLVGGRAYKSPRERRREILRVRPDGV